MEARKELNDFARPGHPSLAMDLSIDVPRARIFGAWNPDSARWRTPAPAPRPGRGRGITHGTGLSYGRKDVILPARLLCLAGDHINHGPIHHARAMETRRSTYTHGVFGSPGQHRLSISFQHVDPS
jgi:hypothetical protein